MRKCLAMQRDKKLIPEELQGLEAIEEERALYGEEKMRKAKAISDLDRTTLMEEVSWRQKLWALWLREGDKCMKSFS